MKTNVYILVRISNKLKEWFETARYANGTQTFAAQSSASSVARAAIWRASITNT